MTAVAVSESDPFARVSLLRQLTQNAIVAFEQQSKIALLRIFLLLQRMNLNRVPIARRDVLALFGDNQRWRDASLDDEQRRSMLMPDYEIYFSTEQIDALCRQALIVDVQRATECCSTDEKISGAALLAMEVQRNLGWQKIQ